VRWPSKLKVACLWPFWAAGTAVGWLVATVWQAVCAVAGAAAVGFQDRTADLRLPTRPVVYTLVVFTVAVGCGTLVLWLV
jgi:hypothetical protein